MYTKGTVRLVDQLCETYDDGYCDDYEHVHSIEDARRERVFDSIEYKYPCVYLPHSCDQWVIGGAKQVKEMIEDLQEILKQVEEHERL